MVVWGSRICFSSILPSLQNSAGGSLLPPTLSFIEFLKQDTSLHAISWMHLSDEILLFYGEVYYQVGMLLKKAYSGIMTMGLLLGHYGVEQSLGCFQ